MAWKEGGGRSCLQKRLRSSLNFGAIWKKLGTYLLASIRTFWRKPFLSELRCDPATMRCNRSIVAAYYLVWKFLRFGQNLDTNPRSLKAKGYNCGLIIVVCYKVWSMLVRSNPVQSEYGLSKYNGLHYVDWVCCVEVSQIWQKSGHKFKVTQG